jgi:hypothetical protein
MTPVKRIQDMLPALIVFAVVAAFGTYATIAFVARDPWWINTLVELREERAAPAPAAEPANRRHPHRTAAARAR